MSTKVKRRIGWIILGVATVAFSGLLAMAVVMEIDANAGAKTLWVSASATMIICALMIAGAALIMSEEA